MGVRVQIIKNYYYLAITRNGHRSYESLHIRRTGTKTDRELDRLAEMCRAKREIQILCGEFDLIDATGSKMRLYDYMKSIADTKGPKNHYGKCLKYLAEYPAGDTIRLKEITTEWLKGFQGHLFKAGISNSTVKHYMDAIKCTLNKAIKEKKITHNPAENLPTISVPQPLMDVLTMADIKKLDETPVGGNLGAEVKRAFLFACFTGLRISDIRTLTWKNIADDKIRIRMHKTERILEIPIHHTAKKYIEENDTEFVFPLIATTKTNCITYFQLWAKNAGVDKTIGWHTARRSFATIAIENGVDQFVISKLLGHTSVRHTAVYSQVSMPLKQKALDKIPGI